MDDFDTENPKVDDSDSDMENLEEENSLTIGDPEVTNQQTNINTVNEETVDENLEEDLEESMEENENVEENVDVDDTVDEIADNKKGSRLHYQIELYNAPGSYWDDAEGLITDASDMVLSMIQNYSDMVPKVSPKSVLTTSKSTPQNYYTKGLRIFEADAYDATKQELDKNLIGRGCVEVLPMTEVNNTIKKKALNYLIFLKRK